MDRTAWKLNRRAFLAQSAAVLAVSSSARAHVSFAAPIGWVSAVPQQLPLDSFKAGGDLGHRTAQNFARLQEEMYRPPLLWRQTNWKSWPGDFEGRALLAVTLLTRATGHEPDYFPAMVAAYPAQLNAQGYFGPLLDLHAINEQQLSGHGWFLRGLCEYFEWKHDPATLDQIRAIVRNLALPLRGKYAVYPINPEVRAKAAAPANPGSVDGHLSGQHGDWAVSSDTGCAFIFLDGIAHAWVVLRDAKAPEVAALKALVDEAIARFAEIDLVAIKAQTHASLTAMRALLRVYAATGDAALLRAAQARYHLYRTTAMTEHYANTNWFGRPDSWTEPCAIIDSFMVATQLWQHTGDAAYLEDAHHIWFNGVGRGMRANGGFGTDTCAGFKTAFVKVRSYEAYFCCTMRGGEGHARAAQYLYFTRQSANGGSELTVPFFSDSEAHLTFGPTHIFLKQTTAYPQSGAVRLEVTGAGSVSARAEDSTVPLTLRLFAPSWTLDHRLIYNGKPLAVTLSGGFLIAKVTLKMGDVLVLDQKIRVAARDPISSTVGAGSYVFEAGPLILAPVNPAANAEPPLVGLPRNAKFLPAETPGVYGVAGTNVGGVPFSFAPINDLNSIAAKPRDPCARQILFRDGLGQNRITESTEQKREYRVRQENLNGEDESPGELSF